jgi:hypothetical protein
MCFSSCVCADYTTAGGVSKAIAEEESGSSSDSSSEEIRTVTADTGLDMASQSPATEAPTQPEQATGAAAAAAYVSVACVPAVSPCNSRWLVSMSSHTKPTSILLYASCAPPQVLPSQVLARHCGGCTNYGARYTRACSGHDAAPLYLLCGKLLGRFGRCCKARCRSTGFGLVESLWCLGCGSRVWEVGRVLLLCAAALSSWISLSVAGSTCVNQL